MSKRKEQGLLSLTNGIEMDEGQHKCNGVDISSNKY